MQHKTTFGLHRATLKNRRARQVFAAQRQLDLVKQVFQADIAGFVDHKAQGTAFTVLAHVDHAAHKGLVIQARHGDQEVMREVDRFEIQGHGLILR